MYAQNQIQLIGHLTEDPQLRQVGNGTSVVDLNIKTISNIIGDDGQARAIPAFHTVTVWRRMAEIVGDYCRAGSQIYIVGRAKTDSWEDEKGNKRYKTKVIADDIVLLDPKQDSGVTAGSSELTGGLNSAVILGNLTRDPELRQTTSGQQVANFSVATNRNWLDRASNERKEETEFHNVVAWGTIAAAAAEELKKGQKCYARGRLQTRSWDTPDGEKRYITEIIAEEIIRLGVRDHNLAASNGGGAPVSTAKPATTTPATPAAASTSAATPSTEAEKEPDLPAINYESDIKPEDLPF